jgi:hypothetical protein
MINNSTKFHIANLSTKIIVHQKKRPRHKRTYADGNLGAGLEQAHNCSRVNIIAG